MKIVKIGCIVVAETKASKITSDFQVERFEKGVKMLGECYGRKN